MATQKEILEAIEGLSRQVGAITNGGLGAIRSDVAALGVKLDAFNGRLEWVHECVNKHEERLTKHDVELGKLGVAEEGDKTNWGRVWSVMQKVIEWGLIGLLAAKVTFLK